MTNYRILEKPSEQPRLFTDSKCYSIYHFHDVATYEKISAKESVDTKEFRPK